jgi:uncharacterized protein
LIDRSFLHCPGVGPVTQDRLKKAGYQTWKDCLDNEAVLPVSGNKRRKIITELGRSMKALEKNDLGYLIDIFPVREHWRILAANMDRAVYMDIETSGLSRYDSFVTLITCSRNGQFSDFVYGENLDEFLDYLDPSMLLVTFNGTSFDLPFLEHHFHIPGIGIPHIDLRWIAYHAGYKSGLKEIEGKMGIERPEELKNISGEQAVFLFHMWQAGKNWARDKLIQYCRADVSATRIIAEKIINSLKAG